MTADNETIERVARAMEAIEEEIGEAAYSHDGYDGWAELALIALDRAGYRLVAAVGQEDA